MDKSTQRGEFFAQFVIFLDYISLDADKFLPNLLYFWILLALILIWM